MKKILKLDISLLLMRMVLATVVAAHGVQKLFGWFGGYGFDSTMGFFTETIGLPYILALGVILIETVGMIALAMGFLSRFVSMSLIGIMIGAIVTTHAANGFFMNWFGTQGGEGFEFHLLIIALSAVIAIQGAGALSIDRLFANKTSVGKNPSLAA